MRRQPVRRRVPRAPFVVTATVLAVGACGGRAFDDNSGGSGGLTGGTAGSSGSSGAGGSGGTGAQPGCPTTLPSSGTPCAIQSAECTYSNGSCCEPIRARCTHGAWQILITSCNPPPPKACPSTPPADGSSCAPTSECGSFYPRTCTWGTCNDGSHLVVASCAVSIDEQGRPSGYWAVQTNTCPSDCSTEFQALSDYAAANKQCQVDQDCTRRGGPCATGADYCDGTFYVNHNVNDAKWLELSEAIQTCVSGSGLGCAVCDGIAQPPMCLNGACQARVTF